MDWFLDKYKFVEFNDSHEEHLLNIIKNGTKGEYDRWDGGCESCHGCPFSWKNNINKAGCARKGENALGVHFITDGSYNLVIDRVNQVLEDYKSTKCFWNLDWS